MKTLTLTFAFLIYATVAQAAIWLGQGSDFNDALDWHVADIEPWAETAVEQKWFSFNPFASEPDNTAVHINLQPTPNCPCFYVTASITPLFEDVSKPIHRRMLPEVTARSATKVLCPVEEI